jgi:hypothetical protein
MPQCPVLCSRARLPWLFEILAIEVTRLRFLLYSEVLVRRDREAGRAPYDRGPPVPVGTALRSMQGRPVLLGLLAMSRRHCHRFRYKLQVASWPLQVTSYRKIHEPRAPGFEAALVLYPRAPRPTEIQYDSSRFPGRSYSVSVDGEPGLSPAEQWQLGNGDLATNIDGGRSSSPKHAPAQVSGLPARDRESCASVR